MKIRSLVMTEPDYYGEKNHDNAALLLADQTVIVKWWIT